MCLNSTAEGNIFWSSDNEQWVFPKVSSVSHCDPSLPQWVGTRFLENQTVQKCLESLEPGTFGE